jgi:hypothetical protein
MCFCMEGVYSNSVSCSTVLGYEKFVLVATLSLRLMFIVLTGRSNLKQPDHRLKNRDQ